MRHGAIAALAFILGFGVASALGLWSDRAQAERLLQAATTPLFVASKTGDDLLALDWARRFEHLDGVVAFNARSGERTLASGGDTRLLDASPKGAFRWSPPAHYQFTRKEGPLVLEVLLRSHPGPLGWGLLGGLLCLTGSLLTLRLAPHHPSPPPPASTQPPQAPSLPGPTPLGGPSGNQAFLRLDARWTIQEASKETLLGRGCPPGKLLGQHLLELEPHPSLLELLEKSKKGTASKGFNRFPHLNVQVTPLEDGGALLTWETPPDDAPP